MHLVYIGDGKKLKRIPENRRIKDAQTNRKKYLLNARTKGQLIKEDPNGGAHHKAHYFLCTIKITLYRNVFWSTSDLSDLMRLNVR
jgi:hypothetical protein